MRNLLLAFLLLAFISSAKMKAQAPILSIDSISYTLPDSVFIGANYSYTVTIRNVGNAVFANNIVDLYFAVDSAFFPTAFVLFDSSLAVLNLTDSINIGATVAISGTFDVSSAFSVGNNTVVIWPLARFGNAVTSDSLFVPMFVRGSILNISDLSSEIEASLYPNPSTGNIYFNSHENKFLVNRIVVRDIAGRLVKEANDFPIDLLGLESGVYFIDVVNDKNQTKRFKIVKQ